MTFQQEATLREAIQKLIPMIQKQRDQHITEENTKSRLIDPVLVALEWNVGNADEVDHERRDTKNCNPVDYALMVGNQPKIIVEAKSLGANLKTGYQELFGNASVSGIGWCVLTDGDTYRVYNAGGDGGIEEKLFFQVCLSDGKGDTVKKLSLLSRSNMTSIPSGIDIEWKAYDEDKRVENALQAMMNPTDPVEKLHKKLIHLIRQNQKCCDLKPEAITASLMRLAARDRGEVIVAQRPVDSLPQKVDAGPDQPLKPTHGAMAAFCDVFSNRDTITRSELVEMMAVQGCSEVTIKNYISYAKRTKKGTPGIDAVSNPFPFQLEETKDERGSKILRKVVDSIPQKVDGALGEVNVGQHPADSLPAAKAEPTGKHKIGNAAEIFRTIIGTSAKIFVEADVIEKLMSQSGCTLITARSYIDYAKHAMKGSFGGKGQRANPFPFQLEETKDERGNKILRKVEQPR